MLHVKGPVAIGGNLREAVSSLLKEVPTEAHGLIVMIHADGLHEVQGASILGYPVRFDPIFGDPKLAGTVSVGYGVGNLE